MRNIIFESEKATIHYKSSEKVLVESEGSFLKRLERLSKELK